MTHNSLIESLAADLQPVRHRSIGREAALFGILVTVEFLLVLAFLMRPDMRRVIHEPIMWWKMGSLLAIAIPSLWGALESFSPTGSARRALRWASLLVGAALFLGLSIGSGRDDASLIARLAWPNGLICAGSMIVLSIPVVVMLGILMKRAAPTNRQQSGLAVGLAGATWGAFVYTLACRADDPLYIAVWYLVGCAIVTATARLILPRMSRW